MTLKLAKLLAGERGRHMVYQESRPWHHRGIKTEFSPEDYEATDWMALGVEVISGVAQ